MNTKLFTQCLSALSCLLLLTSLSARADFDSSINYKVKDLGKPKGSDYIQIEDLNDNGVIVGYASGVNDEGDEITDSFILENSKFKIFQEQPADDDLSQLRINNSNEIVGSLITNNRVLRAFIRHANGKIEKLPTVHKYEMGASGINSTGEVVGTIYSDKSKPFYPYIYKNGQVNEITSISVPNFPNVIAEGINDEGEIIGNAYNSLSAAPARSHGFLYKQNQLIDLSELIGPDLSYPLKINNNGDVLIYQPRSSGNTYRESSFVYSKGNMQEVPSLPKMDETDAVSINDSGDVVGTCYKLLQRAPFLYHAGQMYDLTEIKEKAGLDLLYPQCINNKGQIVALGVILGGNENEEHVILLTPQ